MPASDSPDSVLPDARLTPRATVPRRGRKAISTAAPGPLGEDILLARHGGRIDRLVQDTRNGLTVALLDGGGTDSAPNRLGHGSAPMNPVERSRARWTTLSSDEHTETRRELAFLARLSAAWLAVSAAVLGVMIWGSVEFLDPEDWKTLMTSYYGVSPAQDH